jgi:hypothetical protein
MSAQQTILQAIESKGVKLYLSGGRIKISAGSAVDNDTLASIRQNKEILIALLSGVEVVGTATPANEPPAVIDTLRNHIVPEYEELILCRLSHGPDTLKALTYGTDETELAAALVLAGMEARGLIRFEYRELDGGPPYYEEFITLPEAPPLPVGVKRWQVLQNRRVIFESDMYEMAISRRDALCSGREDCREKGVAIRQNPTLPKLTNGELSQIIGGF